MDGNLGRVQLELYKEIKKVMWNKDFQKNNSGHLFFAYKIKTNYFTDQASCMNILENSFSYSLIQSLLLNNKD